MATDLVIFDCDGVLVDSEVIVIEIEADLLCAAGFPVTTDEIADRFVGLSYPDMMEMLEADHGRPVPAELSTRIQTEAVAAFPDRLQAVAGMPAFLDGLDVPRCVASSSDLDRVRMSLDLTGLDDHFDPAHVFSAQMVENGLGFVGGRHARPSPQPSPHRGGGRHRPRHAPRRRPPSAT